MPQTYQTIVKETNPNKFYVINETQNMILNFSQDFKPFFKKYITNSKKDKFSIISHRQINYSKDGLFCSITANFTGKEHYILHKIDNKSPFENIPTLYHRALEIKAAKLKDVQELAVKYVPPEHKWFYRQFEDDTNNNPDLSDYEC